MTRSTNTILAVLSLAILSAGTFFHLSIDTQSSQAHTATCTPFAAPDISAEAAYILDLKTNAVLFEKNAEAQLPLASLTKLVTALAASAVLAEEEGVTISRTALASEGDSGFTEGEQWKARDLASFTLITSSNDGARALALAAAHGVLDEFIVDMNTLVRTRGLVQTYFLNETGLDVSSTTAGGYGSARDVALLLKSAYQEDNDTLFSSAQSASVYTSLSGLAHKATHTSAVAGAFPGALIIKTGFTDLAGGNLAVLVEALPGRAVAVVVLGATRVSRDSDVMALVSFARDTLKRGTLCNTL